MILHFKQYRDEFYNDTVLSNLIVGLDPICHILEDTDRGLKQAMTEAEVRAIKVKGQTAIPYGSFQVVITYSQKFRMFYPLFLGTTGFVGIRFHCGTNKNHTEGCVLPGMERKGRELRKSTEAFDKVFFMMLKHKTDLVTAESLMVLHTQSRYLKRLGKMVEAAKCSEEFGKIYHPKSNANSILWTIEKATQNVIYHNA